MFRITSFFALLFCSWNVLAQTQLKYHLNCVEAQSKNCVRFYVDVNNFGTATKLAYSGSIKTELQFKWFLDRMSGVSAGDETDDIIYSMYMRNVQECKCANYNDAADCLLRRANWFLSKNND